MTEKTSPQIHAVILAGGLARRMNGVEKGLQKLQNLPLIAHILQRLSPQLSTALRRNISSFFLTCLFTKTKCPISKGH